ncbi:vacuolar sorting-associated 13A [Brachionus plicatilis]|uniref:Vacuolar sorting-associated 13A n=1 Tax=Brachionus plicatilis TaxID=10195 RepID=A0A3M7R112_BRAPC|nr:vacuolar sorting-associated 13A [Brachionus plicatilis]
MLFDFASFFIESKKKFEISEGKYGYYLSFLDGLQRVLIFTDSLSKLNEEIVGSKDLKGDEYVLSLTNLGLSLIDDINKTEILYFSLTSSSIDWGERTSKQKIFKSFSTHRIEKIEEAYQKYLLSEEENIPKSPSSSLQTKSKLFQIDEEDEVDFERMVLYVGKQEIPIERQYAPGLFINLFSSLAQTTVHLVIHKLQIDNQLYDCVFPVLFSKVLPPKSMSTKNVFKPIIELSMVQNHSQQTKTTEMKYFQVLIQEFSVKIDINFLNALSQFLISDGLSSEKKHVRDSTEFFRELNEIKKSFHDVFETIENLNDNKQKNDKIYYDYVHISPIKMHFSFSLAGTDAFKNKNIFLNNPLSKSIGLVLTDIQDAVFKLGFFQISNTVYTSKELSDKVITHYKSQVIKQSYIIFLGLDVLGNPFGLISGLAEGLKSLFYEPCVGIVQGPGEFVEGVTLGIRSFAGSTIGGAAGAVSKITGTLGKGLATLSMDKEFQKSRQKASDSKSNIAQSFGQNLVKGFVSGFTGIYEKPKEGIAEGGLGFFKGVGKGFLGAVAKPTTGVIDFASQTLEGVRKITVQEESINRSRPPRAIYGDRIIRPYQIKEAQAVFIYKTMEKSAFLHDVYKASIEVSNDHKEFLISTNRHLFLAKNAFGNWKLEWNFEYEDLMHEPKLVKNSIEIVLKKKDSSLFGSGEPMKKRVNIFNEVQAIKFLAKVRQAISEKDF